MKQRHALRQTIEQIYAAQGLHRDVFVSVKPLPLDEDKASVLARAELARSGALLQETSPFLAEWVRVRERTSASEHKTGGSAKPPRLNAHATFQQTRSAGSTPISTPNSFSILTPIFSGQAPAEENPMAC